MIEISDAYVVETLQRVIDQYTETVGRGDGKNTMHTKDILALQEALYIVKAVYNQCNSIIKAGR